MAFFGRHDPARTGPDGQFAGKNTAQLPQIADAAPLPAGFADNTGDAILSGCLAAQAGAIERAVRMHGADACLLSGGAAPRIAQALALPFQLVDNIVMIGLQTAARTLDLGETHA